MNLIAINIRCWSYSGDFALENIVLGMEEHAVRDDANHLSSEEFDACLAIVVCRCGTNTGPCARAKTFCYFDTKLDAGL